MILDVEYERDVPGAEDAYTVQSLRRSISFKDVRAFVRVPFPGNMFFNFNGDSSEFGLGELTEFMESEWACPAREIFHPVSVISPQGVKHFSIQFLSENVAFHVLAETVSLSEEQLVV